jgi:alkylhydroperoxidase family enzyme
LPYLCNVSSINEQEKELNMERPFLKLPTKVPLLLKVALWISKKETGKDLLPARLMTWYPKAAIGAGVLELMTAKGKNVQEKRLLNLVRLQASFVCSCAFCIDMNAAGLDTFGITDDEILALQGRQELKSVSTFSNREILALEYAVIMSNTPLVFTDDFIEKLKCKFSEKEIIMLASTIAGVNYWARFNQALGVPSAGFSERCFINE